MKIKGCKTRKLMLVTNKFIHNFNPSSIELIYLYGG